VRIDTALGEVWYYDADESQPVAECASIVARTVARAAAWWVGVELHQVVHVVAMAKRVEFIPTRIVALLVPPLGSIGAGVEYGRHDGVTVDGGVPHSDGDVLDTGKACFLKPGRQDIEDPLLKDVSADIRARARRDILSLFHLQPPLVSG
jgi:hypothetical protein